MEIIKKEIPVSGTKQFVLEVLNFLVNMVLIVIIIAIATLFNGRLSEIVGQILDNLGAFARGGTQ